MICATCIHYDEIIFSSFANVTHLVGTERLSSGGRAAAHNVDSIPQVERDASALTCNDLFRGGQL